MLAVTDSIKNQPEIPERFLLPPDHIWWCEPNIGAQWSCLTFGVTDPAWGDELVMESGLEENTNKVLWLFEKIRSGQAIEVDVDLTNFFDREGNEIRQSSQIEFASGTFRQVPDDRHGLRAQLELDAQQLAGLTEQANRDDSRESFRLLHLLSLVAPDSCRLFTRLAVTEFATKLGSSSSQREPIRSIDDDEFIKLFKYPNQIIYGCELKHFLHERCSFDTFRRHVKASGLVESSCRLNGWYTTADRILNVFVPYVSNLRRKDQMFHDFIENLEDAGVINRPQTSVARRGG